ncbi:MAG: conjugal transfer protein TraF [Gammaproteobacteria bacterium]|nr:conjugal transfer protein TraF [Gammaproteobacteria bacterium]
MDRTRFLLALFAIVTIPTATAAPYANLATRSLAMGGLSVVTANADEAPQGNPALLQGQTKDDDGSVLLSVGGGIHDPNDLATTLNNFQTAYGNLVAATTIPEGQAALTAANSALSEASSRNFLAEAGVSLSSTFLLANWAAALHLGSNNFSELGVGSNDGNPPAIVYDPNFPLIDPTTNGTVDALIFSNNELGLTLARKFQFYGLKSSIGFTPKIQYISTALQSQSLDTFDANNVNLAVGAPVSYSNIDAGMVVEVAELVNVGLVVKNIIPLSIPVGAQTISLQPQVRGGVAFRTRAYTLGMDLDLAPNQPLLSGGATQYMIIGTEMNANNMFQVRMGYRTDLLNSNDTNYTFGFGLSPYGLHVDLAALYNPNNPAAGVTGSLAIGVQF